MSGASIAAEINAALVEVGEELGTGEQKGIIVRKGANSGSDFSPVYGPDVEFVFTVVRTSFSNRERQGTAIKATDTKIVCGVGETVPVVSDTMRINGTDYLIYGVDSANPVGTDLVHRIWARK